MGGEGSDVFDIQLDLSDSTVDTPAPTVETLADTYLVIGDFDPAEDVLTVQINRDEAGATREMISAEIFSSDVPDGQPILQTIVMNFAATETSGVHTAAIRLGPGVNVTIDDIVFVQN